MNSLTLKKVEITKELAWLSETEIDQVKHYVEFLLFQKSYSNQPTKKLEGIWKNKGFENIDNLEEEIHVQIRRFKQ